MSGRSSWTWRTRSSGPHQGRGGAGLGGIVGVVLEARAGTGGEVDQDVGAARADALDHLAVERAVHAGLGGLGVAHMNVDDGGAGLGGVDAGMGDLLRRHRHGRVLARRVGRAGHGARDDHLALHGRPSPGDWQAMEPQPSHARKPQSWHWRRQPQAKFPAACLALCTALSQQQIPFLERIRTVSGAISACGATIGGRGLRTGFRSGRGFGGKGRR